MARWNDFSICQGLNNQTGQASTPAASIPTTGPIPGAAGATLNESTARNFLLQDGIAVNKNACPAGVRFQDVQGGCTTLGGIKQSTLDAVAAFKDACVQYNSGCTVTITGGTELGHTAGHTTGDKVDIAATSQVTSFIRSKYTLAGTRADGAILYKSPNGTVFADEGNHIDTTAPI